MSPAADSAGQSFEGRSFEPNPFAGDTGEADRALIAALEAFHTNEVSREKREELAEAVVDALGAARILIPLIAHAGDYGLTDDGRVVEKTQELSVVHVEGPDGRPVAPVFSSVAALTAWKPDARPIPVDAARAAIAAASDGLASMILDPGAKLAFSLRRGALRCLAQSLPYVSAVRDQQVLEAIGLGVQAGGSAIESHTLRSGDPRRQMAGPEIVVDFVVKAGLDQAAITELVAAMNEEWNAQPVIAERVDGLGVKLVSA
ncbi:MAG: hypothetical protein RL247_450 [Actinomycetota bacterium]